MRLVRGSLGILRYEGCVRADQVSSDAKPIVGANGFRTESNLDTARAEY